jgi:peptidylprolyl isomerase
MGTPVKDRSGRGLPPKAERRALGKAAARKRAAARRRRELLNGVLRVAGPIVAIGVIITVVWLFAGGDSQTPTTSPTTSATTPTTEPEPAWTLPAGLDPQLGTKPEVTAGEGTLSELVVTTLIAGDGPPIEAGKRVAVNYVGVRYDTGEEFDATWSKGRPYEFTAGGGHIQGWDEGLLGVPAGSRVQLDIPSAMAYNEGDLRFVVDVLSVD